MKEALLVIDMSNDFVADNGNLTAGKSAQAIVPYIVDQAQRMLEEGNLVVFCMDTHAASDKHFEEWPVHNVEGTWGHELYGALYTWYNDWQHHANVHYIPKQSYNAFYQTDLGETLRAHGVEKVHITGVCTDICDFLTAAGAYDEGFATGAHRRGCATFTEHHDMFLQQMQLCFHTEIVE